MGEEAENSSTEGLAANANSATAVAEPGTGTPGEGAEATGKAAELPEGETGSPKDKTVDYEARYKETQASFTKVSQELAALKQERSTDKSAELQAKIDALENQLSDPSALVSRMEQARRAKEEEEALDPSEKSIRELRSQMSQMQSDRLVERAESVFEDLKDTDPFFNDRAKEIVQLVAQDQDLKTLILRDPVKGFKAVKGQLIDDYEKTLEGNIRKRIEEEEKKKIEEAKATKTSLSASGASGGPKGTSKEVGMTTEEAFDEYYRLHPEKKPAGW